MQTTWSRWDDFKLVCRLKVKECSSVSVRATNQVCIVSASAPHAYTTDHHWLYVREPLEIKKSKKLKNLDLAIIPCSVPYVKWTQSVEKTTVCIWNPEVYDIFEQDYIKEKRIKKKDKLPEEKYLLKVCDPKSSTCILHHATGAKREPQNSKSTKPCTYIYIYMVQQEKKTDDKFIYGIQKTFRNLTFLQPFSFPNFLSFLSKQQAPMLLSSAEQSGLPSVKVCVSVWLQHE